MARSKTKNKKKQKKQGNHHATGSSAHTPPLLYDLRVFLDSDGSARSVKLPLAKHSVDGASAEGSWELPMRCEGAPGTDEEGSEEQFEDEVGGRGVPGNEGEGTAGRMEGGVGAVLVSLELIRKRGGGRRTVGRGGEEFQQERDLGGGVGSRREGRGRKRKCNVHLQEQY